MGYGDYTPSGGGRPKPLTKAQIRKMQEAFKNADIVSEQVREKEKEEQNIVETELDTLLKIL